MNGDDAKNDDSEVYYYYDFQDLRLKEYEIASVVNCSDLNYLVQVLWV